ncbi:hypothetical protein [Deinococcus rufus]|uniref:Oxidoreductase molybdopterin-binding domain-containing protein n=1 Tax=Deinococcus rufus TaxID=2136097 RepID=A0ABV7Z9M2_9DEIO
MRIGQPLFLAAVLGLVACTRPAAQTYTAVASDPALSVAGPVVLTARSAAGTETRFTRADLARLGLVTYTTPDPSRKNRPHRYVGPLLASVLQAAGIPDDATLHLIARDQYTFDLDLGPITDVPAVLALKSDDRVLELRDYGPVYLTFPYHAYRLDQNLYNGAWVWQLYRIEERPAAP